VEVSSSPRIRSSSTSPGTGGGKERSGIVEEGILDGLDDPQVKAFTVLEPILTESVVIDEAATSKP